MPRGGLVEALFAWGVIGDDVRRARLLEPELKTAGSELAFIRPQHEEAQRQLEARRTAEAEQKEMLALDVGQHERPRDAVEHVGRGRAASPLLQPRVPGDPDRGVPAPADRGVPGARGSRAPGGVRGARGSCDRPRGVSRFEPRPAAQRWRRVR